MPIHHLVLLRFKESTSAAQIDLLLAGFAELRKLIPGIIGFESGPNISTENLAKGFTHIAQITFSDLAARDAYLPAPAHQAFVARLQPCLEDVLVFDFSTADYPA